MSDLITKLKSYKVLPVVTPPAPEQCVELARALADGGIKAIEITLRNETAMEALKAVKASDVQIDVGVGTLTSAKQVEAVAELGLDFGISPGVTPAVLQAAVDTGLNLVPGITSPSEMMLGMEYGLDTFKLFPAGAIGGYNLLKALAGPFPNISFCPTGGISLGNAREFLDLPNVVCIGGSWMVPNDLVNNQDWDAITQLCAEAVSV
jgi:2-dehydro-3-deoxyphosphogluconate aldolase / (4S)-4-hydroxy-2-oxoglutarate aldolase